MSEVPPPQYTPQPVEGIHDAPDRPNPLYLLLLVAAAIVMVIALFIFKDNEENATVTIAAPAASTATTTTDTTAQSSSGSDSSTGGSTAGTEIVKQLQTDLTTLGFYSGPIDGNYGAETEAAVAAFQESVGLTPDGRYGPETHAAMEAALEAAGEETSGTVEEIQTVLSDLGWYEGAVDGDYGPATVQAVKDFQTHLGVPADGIVGPQTIAAYEAQCVPDPSGCVKGSSGGATTSTTTGDSTTSTTTAGDTTTTTAADTTTTTAGE